MPPFAMIQGRPVRVRGVNTTNLKRCGFDEGDISALKDAFRDLFNGSRAGASQTALSRLSDAAGANRHVRRLVESLRVGAGDRGND